MTGHPGSPAFTPGLGVSPPHLPHTADLPGRAPSPQPRRPRLVLLQGLQQAPRFPGLDLAHLHGPAVPSTSTPYTQVLMWAPCLGRTEREPCTRPCKLCPENSSLLQRQPQQANCHSCFSVSLKTVSSRKSP